MEGTGLAEYLADRCVNVTVVDEGDIYGTGPTGPQPRDEQKVTTFFGARYEAITKTGMTFITVEGVRKTLEADTIIIATSPLPHTGLLKVFEGMAPEIYLVGMEDREPGSIMNAIGNGFLLAQGI
jgi:thioredoxin reductase